jgi:hypothetical protein
MQSCCSTGADPRLTEQPWSCEVSCYLPSRDQGTRGSLRSQNISDRLQAGVDVNWETFKTRVVFIRENRSRIFCDRKREQAFSYWSLCTPPSVCFLPFGVHKRLLADSSSQGQAERQAEGHLHGNLCHGVMETHVEFLRDGFEKHPAGTQTDGNGSVFQAGV